MRLAIFLLLNFLLPTASEAQQGTQKIVQVGAGEYLTTYLTNEGKLFVTCWKNGKYQLAKLPVDSVKAVDGAQYTNVALDSNGAVYVVGIHPNGVPYAKHVAVDEDGKPFTGNSKVYGWFQGYLTLKNGQVYTWGEDLLKLNSGVQITTPRALPLPAGKTFKKLVPLTMGEPCIVALATDGSVWKYAKSRTAPEKVKLPAAARNIAGVGAAAIVVETATDLLAWGYLGTYLGIEDMGNTPRSIKKKWTAAGCVFPSKELVGNYNTLHIIDANDNLFGAGENVMGEIGNGKENANWKTSLPNSYAWNWHHGQLITGPVQIPGKFKNLCTSNTIAFYFYVQDMGDNWYSWGRNKARSLGTGISLVPDDESRYPNALGVPAPTLVTPLTVKWKLHKRITQDFEPLPLSNAGVNQYIRTTTATLDGTGSSLQGGKIVKYEWSQISGTPAQIVSPGKATTIVANLAAGTSVFQLMITSDKGVTARSETTIVVTLSNQ
ncbi:MAG: hypothetical protein EOP51_19475 [Sphingobacteriales bacterium]|nr:MAG: hypothetical protein EOP51_19475 [Sphingobacteriales bacterium]